MIIIDYPNRSPALEVIYEKLTQADQDYYLNKKHNCSFCEKPLIENQSSDAASFRAKISHAFNTLNPFAFEPDMTPFGHRCLAEQKQAVPSLFHCYHKVCLEKTAVYIDEMKTTMKLDACCLACTKNIANIGVFLTKTSWKERFRNSVSLVCEVENLILSSFKEIDIPKMNAWNIKSDLYSLVTGVALGTLSGGLMGAFYVQSQNSVEESSSDTQALLNGVISGALAGASNAFLMSFASRATVLAIAPLVSVGASENMAIGAAIVGGQVRSVFGASAIGLGSGITATRLWTFEALRGGATIGSVLILIGAGWGKINGSFGEELTQKIRKRELVTTRDIEVAKMRNAFAADDEVFANMDHAAHRTMDVDEEDWVYLNDLGLSEINSD